MKFKIFLLLLPILIISAVTLYFIDHIKAYNAKNVFFEIVENVDGNIIALNNGRKVQIAGIYIPQYGELNYLPEMQENINKLLVGKKIKFKILLKKDIRYPKFDLVNLYDKNGKCLNTELLKTGQAFFDHGYYKGKKRCQELEKKAKANSLGIWKNKERLVPLFISSRNWWDFHYPECPEVKKIKPKDKEEYYFFPQAVFFYKGPAECKYCREIEIQYNRSKLFTYGEEDWLRDKRNSSQ